MVAFAGFYPHESKLASKPLSDHLRFGIKEFPDESPRLTFSPDGKGACALACIYRGLYRERWTATFQYHNVGIVHMRSAIFDNYPMTSRKILNPANQMSQLVLDIIVELNDKHGWQRIEIAEWLETLGV